LVGLIAAETGILALELVSKTETGVQGDNTSEDPAVSADGRFVAFRSDATNLVPSDTNGRTDVFVKDRQTGLVERVSVSSAGIEPNNSCFDPAISGNGRFVSFSSHATNLVDGDTNAQPDVFLYDRDTDTLERVSVSTAGVESDRGCGLSSISDDGRYVCFQSDATNLVPGDTNGARDVFVRDRQNGQTLRVSTDASGNETFAGSYSSNGKVAGNGPWVFFSSTASNLVEGDTNGVEDIFAKNMETGEIERVSEAGDGTEANGYSGGLSVSSDGLKVVFHCAASNLVPGDTNGQIDVFLKDRSNGVLRRVSLAAGGIQPDGGCGNPVLSGDGSTLAFISRATNLVPGDMNGETDTFVVYLANGEIRRVSVREDGSEGNDETYSPDLSADGSLVVFMSDVQDLVPEDTNPAEDVFAAVTIFQQPDHSVGRSASPLSALGDGIYNLNGAGQTLTLVSRKAKRLEGSVHLQNDGNATSDLVSRGTAGNRFFKITYLDVTGNITASLTTGQLETAALAPGQFRSMRVKIAPQKSALSHRVNGKSRWLKKTLPILVSTASTGGNAKSDLVILKAWHR
jgi:Tol biopolymer transport system component